jgi:YD repeat-containing protein
MNPGVFIMGGGGGGGGSRGRGGRGGKGKQGAGGKGGGRRARGGGRNASACGPGSGGGCPNPSHGGRGTQAGDPIDPVTGRVYTVAVADLSLPGPLPLVLERAYSSSAADEDVGLGFGWKHSLAWSIEETRAEIRVVEPLGEPTVVDKPELNETLPLPCGRLRRLEHGYVLERDDDIYVFRLEDARDGRYRLSRITDANGSAIELVYSEAGLSAIVDSAGRLVRVQRHASGRIAAFEVKNAMSQGQWIAFRRYTYDAAGRLVSAENGDVICAYTYGPRGDVTRQTATYSGDVHVVESTFDALGARAGMTSTWSRGQGGAAIAAALAVQMKRDVVGRALEVWHGPAAPIELRYDPFGAEILRVLPQGGRVETEFGQDRSLSRVAVRRPWSDRAVRPGEPAWVGPMQGDETLRRTFAWSPAGHLLWVDDAETGRTEMSYDANGRVLAEKPSKGAPKVLCYGPRGDLDEPAASGTRRRYDRGGRLLERDGVVMRYDGRGRLVTKRVPGPDNSVSEWRFSWAANGLLTAVVSPGGERTEFAYDPFGRRVEKRTRQGDDVISRTRYAWDGEAVLRSIEERSTGGGAVVTQTRDYLQLPDSLVPLAQRVCTGDEEGRWEYFLSNYTTLHPEALLGGAGRGTRRRSSRWVGRTRGAPRTSPRRARIAMTTRARGATTRGDGGAYDPALGGYGGLPPPHHDGHPVDARRDGNGAS